MSSHNALSRRPVVTIRVSDQVHAELKKRADLAGVALAQMAERYLNAGLEAEGVSIPGVRAEAKAAKAMAAVTLQRIAKAVNAEIIAVLEEEGVNQE